MADETRKNEGIDPTGNVELDDQVLEDVAGGLASGNNNNNNNNSDPTDGGTGI